MKKRIGDVYKSNVDIIYNPVSVRYKKRFIERARRIFPEVYEEYTDMIFSERVRMGEVSLYQVAKKQCVLNGFCYNRRGNLNLVAFTKTLVELSNIAHEYKLTVGIGVDDIHLGDKCSEIDLESIIKEAFKNTDGKVIIFTRKR